MSNREDELRRLCQNYTLTLKEPSPGHFQISGHGVLVNYWPNSKRRTAHVNGGGSVSYCDPFDVIKMVKAGGKTVSLKTEAAKAIAKQKRPPQSTAPATTDPIGSQNFYCGERPPWEFETLIMSASDLLRLDAHELECRAEKLRQSATDMEDPRTYRNAL